MKKLSSIIPKYEGCEQCKDSIGWVETQCRNVRCLAPPDHTHLYRCSCFKAFQHRLISGLRQK